jgi:hypothetical protein
MLAAARAAGGFVVTQNGGIDWRRHAGVPGLDPATVPAYDPARPGLQRVRRRHPWEPSPADLRNLKRRREASAGLPDVCDHPCLAGDLQDFPRRRTARAREEDR